MLFDRRCVAVQGTSEQEALPNGGICERKVSVVRQGLEQVLPNPGELVFIDMDSQ